MRLFAAIGVLAIIVVIGAAVYFFGGYYDVAASQPEAGAVNWVLARIRMASVDHRATEAPPMTLDDAALVQAGARAFATRGCVTCHGAPGVKWAKFTEGMQPYPPDLKDIVNEREPRELFWVVKNGIRMTAMPSFGAVQVPDQEIWSIVAFLKKLPSVPDADYRTWTTQQGAPEPPPGKTPPAPPQQ